MKKFTRIIATMLTLFTLLGVAVSCADTNGGEDTTNAPAETNATPAMPLPKLRPLPEHRKLRKLHLLSHSA